MELTINGMSRTVAPVDNVEHLLAELAVDPRAVVVEVNREIIRRPALATTAIREGDTIEIVHFVGGG